jgi:uncharacterized OB-fold protein
MGSDSADYASAWWAGIRDGRLTIQGCQSCGSTQLYPRRRCVTCASDDLKFLPISGYGTLYTFSTIYQNPPSDFVDQLPYTLGIVVLDEGPRLLTRVIGSEPESLRCEMRMRCVVTRIGQNELPTFEPA